MNYSLTNGIYKPSFKYLKLDPFDARDYNFSDYFKIEPSSWSKFTTNYKKMPPTLDQSTLGSCSANALGQLLRYTHNLPEMVSRLFIYFNERMLEGNIGVDAGACLRDGIKSLASQGVCLESLWPYDINNFTTKPSDECYTQALTQVIKAYYRVNTLDEIKQCLSEGFPVVMGFQVPDVFETNLVAQSGYLPFPSPSNQIIGGHAVIACDHGAAINYMNAEQMKLANIRPDTNIILIANSWGGNWGLRPRRTEQGTYDPMYGGYFAMDEKYFTSNLVSDCWTLRI